MLSAGSLLTFTSFLIGSANCFSPSNHGASRASTALQAELSRDGFLKQIVGTSAALTLVSPVVLPAFAGEERVDLPSGVSYIVTKAGDGPSPTIGELAAVRFKASVVQTGVVLDDCYDTPEAYYTRVGAGGLIKGVEEVIPKMRLGDRFLITVPTKLAFGPKGRPASPGKPRIPGDAIIAFDITMESLPGKEKELIELIGDE